MSTSPMDDDIGDATISETKFIITVDYPDASKVYYFRTKAVAEKVYNAVHDEELPLEKNEGIIKITLCEVINNAYRDTGDVIKHEPTE